MAQMSCLSTCWRCHSDRDLFVSQPGQNQKEVPLVGAQRNVGVPLAGTRGNGPNVLPFNLLALPFRSEFIRITTRSKSERGTPCRCPEKCRCAPGGYPG